jgi:hypothetical protein
MKYKGEIMKNCPYCNGEIKNEKSLHMDIIKGNIFIHIVVCKDCDKNCELGFYLCQEDALEATVEAVKLVKKHCKVLQKKGKEMVDSFHTGDLLVYPIKIGTILGKEAIERKLFL